MFQPQPGVVFGSSEAPKTTPDKPPKTPLLRSGRSISKNTPMLLLNCDSVPALLHHLTVILRTLAFSAAFLLVGCGDVVHSEHSDAAAAQDFMARGWTPECLPTGAYNIKESHDLDLDVGNGSFRFSEADVATLQKNITPYAQNQILRARVSREEFERRGFSFYHHKNFDLAVNWNTREAHFWLL
jgi:hypothetical protein